LGEWFVFCDLGYFGIGADESRNFVAETVDLMLTAQI
jgi:hypothetical protein